MIIQADTHCHTVASTHAYSTVNELAAAASEYGLKLFAMTDHGPAEPDAPHAWHFHNYKILPRKIHGVTLLKGVEANIVDFDGTLDMDEKELSFTEWVIASFHLAVVRGGTAADYTHAYQTLAKNNPLVDVIGHCSTSMFPFDYVPTLKCFKEYGKLVELNESSICYKSGSRENAYEIFKLCKQYEVPIVVNTDCHYASLIGQTPMAEELLTAIDFPSRLIVNRDADEILARAQKNRTISLE